MSKLEVNAQRRREKVPAQARLAAILERLNAGGSVSVAEIAHDFNVSDMTVRRDLAELERKGLLNRVHGGAVPASDEPVTLMDDIEPEFTERAAFNQPSKAAIAREAARVVARHRTIAMDVGTTTFLAAQHLASHGRARIFTNSLRVAKALANSAHDVHLAGGKLRGDEMSITGPVAEAQFQALYFDVALVGVSGLIADGFYDYSMEDSALKRIYIARSATSIVLCDSSKFRRMSLTRVCALNEVSMLITDAPPPPDLSDALAKAGVEIRIADTGD